MPALERRRNLVTVAAAFLAASLSSGTEARESATVWRGEFVYFADSAVLTDCASGRQWPVAMEEDYAAMEKAYLNSRLQPKAPLLVSLEGRLEMRKPMEGPVREHLVVERFKGSEAGATCKTPQPKSERLR